MQNGIVPGPALEWKSFFFFGHHLHMARKCSKNPKVPVAQGNINPALTAGTVWCNACLASKNCRDFETEVCPWVMWVWVQIFLARSFAKISSNARTGLLEPAGWNLIQTDHPICPVGWRAEWAVCCNVWLFGSKRRNLQPN